MRDYNSYKPHPFVPEDWPGCGRILCRDYVAGHASGYLNVVATAGVDSGQKGDLYGL